MFRPLDEVANATPADYLEHAADPLQTGLQMMQVASSKFPLRGDGSDVQMTGHEFLYVGPGSGLVVKFLLDQDQRAQGLETSRRGIASAPDVVRNYCIWSKPWETAFPNKNFHVAFISAYLKELLTEDEWNETLKEVARVSKHSQIYGTITEKDKGEEAQGS